jgi:hypothetical protein
VTRKALPFPRLCGECGVRAVVFDLDTDAQFTAAARRAGIPLET